MKINWKIRFTNPVFLAQLFLAVLMPILAYMGITLQDLTTWALVGDVLMEAIRNPYILGVIVVNVFNTLNDPTTKGVSDSELVLNRRD